MTKLRVFSAIGIAAAVGATTPLLLAQTPDKPRFEVASVKQNKSGDVASALGVAPGGRLIVRNRSLRTLVMWAYQLQSYQLIGETGWMDSARFDIDAEAGTDLPTVPNGTVGMIHLMTQELLRDRFKLVAHTESREQPLYALIMANGNAQLGPQLRESSVDCGANTRPPMAQNVDLTAPAAMRAIAGCGLQQVRRGQLVAGNVEMSRLASGLTPYVDRPVVDRTGLTGNYDFILTFDPALASTPTAIFADPTAASIPVAVQEQLGLRLEPRRESVHVLVLDSAKLPTEN